MGTGFLEVVTTTAEEGLPVVGARVSVLSGDSVLYQLVTDESGLTDTVPLEAPARELTLDVNFEGVPYSVCDVKVEADNFMSVFIRGVEILDGETSILPVFMVPSLEDGQGYTLDIPPHNLVAGEGRRMDVPPATTYPSTPRVLSEVIVPEFITVHLGRPDRQARNVRVPFIYYIKNAASHEIFSTWPAASLEANIYCIISLTLNRIFTEWYRVRGHNFDITNSTQFDQMFVEGGQIFGTIDAMVDRIFNRYIRRTGHLEPFFAEYCDGRRVTCPGLWQWSTVTLANQGLNALQILRHFYPNDVQLVETDNIGGVVESFPGFVLRPGTSGPAVRTLQNWLNRIRVNFPAIPPITNVSGIYGPQTEAAVRAFQSIRELGNLTPNGVVDRATWNRISFTYSAVKRLGELTSEGIIMGIDRTPPREVIREGARGRLVQQAQYLLNFIAEFYPSVPTVIQNSSFTRDMTTAVREFQRLFGLNPDGIIGPLTWNMLYTVYWRIRDNIRPPSVPGDVVPPLPPQPSPPPPPGEVPPYPGALIRVGSRGPDVERIQRCLNSVRNSHPSIGQLNVDGIFGPLTQASVLEFQRIAGLNPDGIVGPLTWNALMPRCYGGDSGGGGGGGTIPPYPGFLIRVGARGDYVRQIQTCLNQVNGAGLATDGIFGPLTQAAVINYQRANGLAPDGIVGPITWGHLMNRCGGAVRAVPIMAALSEQEILPMPNDTETLADDPIVNPERMENMPGTIQFVPGGEPPGREAPCDCRQPMPYIPGGVDVSPIAPPMPMPPTPQPMPMPPQPMPIPPTPQPMPMPPQPMPIPPTPQPMPMPPAPQPMPMPPAPQPMPPAPQPMPMPPAPQPMPMPPAPQPMPMPPTPQPMPMPPAPQPMPPMPQPMPPAPEAPPLCLNSLLMYLLIQRLFKN